MSEKTEGTILLDGMVQGTTPAIPNAEGELRQWVSSAAAVGLVFHLQVDGGSFNVLAGDEPCDASRLGKDPAAKLEQLLDELLRTLPPPRRGQTFSTLRSTEYRPGKEIQTLYTVGPDARVLARQRILDARTDAPPPKPDLKARLRGMGAAVLVAAALVGISSFFVDYRGMIRNAVERASSVEPNEIKIEAGAFEPYFTVEGRTVAHGGHDLVLTLKRKEGFPAAEADLNRLMAAHADSLCDRLAVEALARGYIRIEYFDRNNAFVCETHCRIVPLRQAPTTDIIVPLIPHERPGKLVFGY